MNSAFSQLVLRFYSGDLNTCYTPEPLNLDQGGKCLEIRVQNVAIKFHEHFLDSIFRNFKTFLVFKLYTSNLITISDL